MVVDVEKRAELVRFASGFTSDTSNSELVVRNAMPLLNWVREAADEEDLKARMYALRVYNFNSVPDGEHAPVEDQPEVFLERAGALYGFLAGRGEPGEGGELSEVRIDDDELRVWLEGDS